jgi:malonate transporter and related proteins
LDIAVITLPIFALILLGWGGVKLGLFDEGVGAGLSRFVFWLAFPALLLTSMAKSPAPDGAMAGQIGIWLGVLLAVQIGARVLGFVLGLSKQECAGVAMAATYGNTAFLGTAIVTSLLGPSILPVVAAFVAVENIVVVGLAVANLKLSVGPRTDFAKSVATFASGVFNPTSLGALVGFALALSGAGIPAPLVRPLEMLGSAASPAGLVALGIIMATMPVAAKTAWGETALVVALKCVALPFAMWASFWFLGAPHGVVVAATVLAACPSAVNVFIQARQADVWADQAALAVFATTLVSVVGVSVAAALAGSAPQ